MGKVQIYVMAHKKFDEPDNAIYVPMQVGSALHDELGYLRDDVDDNISVKNPFYNELTGLYWMWKNDLKNDVIGLCHYRRYFLNKNGELLSEGEINNILKSYDIIVSTKLHSSEKNIYDSYVEKHKEQDLVLTRKAIEKKSPEFLDYYDAVMNDHEMYFGNLIIAGSGIVKEYAEWLFGILGDVEANMDLSGYNEYDCRVYGFIAERLLMVWIRKKKLRVYENEVGLVGEKSESKEIVERVSVLLKNNCDEEAYAALVHANETRPDLFFKDSDIKGQLAKLYRIMEISQLEKKYNRNNILDISRDINELIRHYDLICTNLDRLSLNGDFFNYILEKQVSIETILIIMGTIEFSKEEKIKIFNFFANSYLDVKNIDAARMYLTFALQQGN